MLGAAAFGVGDRNLDLSSFGAHLFAEDETTITNLRAELAEVLRGNSLRDEQHQAELVPLHSAQAELEALQPEVRQLKRQLDAARMELAGVHASKGRNDHELLVLREAAARLSAQEIAAREAAKEAVWEKQFQASCMETRMHALEINADLAAKKRMAHLERQLLELRRQADTADVFGRKRADMEARAAASMNAWARRCMRREALLKVQAIFYRWKQLPRQSNDLWEMHVFYLRKQEERHTDTQEAMKTRISGRYGNIINGFLQKGQTNFTFVWVCQCFHLWATELFAKEMQAMERRAGAADGRPGASAGYAGGRSATRGFSPGRRY